ncbi:putative UPF0481 protein At3g02645 [Cornus florida]|uniref:putative UPF0481 protein At3g02645 n=1 Tax=Cornus florida TaxID=4283 RepID=UPI002898C955|nr:putative UPF0481 protein At3g02645 [Cornus florida]
MVGRIQSQYPPLTIWVHLFFGNIMGLENYQRRNMEKERPHHVLHFLHIQYMPACTDDTYTQRSLDDENEIDKMECDETERMESKIIYSATELRLAGVRLKAANTDRNLFDIRFTTAFSCNSCSTLFVKGYIEIPPFSVSDSTESVLRNLIAFELSCHWIPSYFTSFAFLMDLLINTPEDVKLFEDAGIIRNYLGSREEVARLFNGICQNANPSGFHYTKQYKQAMDFCTPWRVSTARFRQYYFGSAWSGISVIAAIILFTLAFMQTLYSMLSFY